MELYQSECIPEPGKSLLHAHLCSNLVIWIDRAKDPSPTELRPKWQNVTNCGIYHLIRGRWDSKFKLKGKQTLKAETKKLGIFLDATLTLCLELGLLGENNEPYFSWRLFEEIINELKYCGLCGITSKTYGINSNSFNKREFIQQLKKNCSQAKFLNGKLTRADTSPFSFLLLIAINKSENLNSFKKRFFIPFINSWRDAVQELEKSRMIHQEPDGSLFVRGRTRDRYTVPPSKTYVIHDPMLIKQIQEICGEVSPLLIDTQDFRSDVSKKLIPLAKSEESKTLGAETHTGKEISGHYAQKFHEESSVR